MTRDVTLAATQFACTWDIGANLATAERLVREAAGRGAQIVLLQELFATPYFPITQDPRHFDLAGPAQGHPVVARFGRLAGELGVVLPVSFFERAGQAFFNSVAMIDADGAVLGVYRKSHIPDARRLPGEVLLLPRRHRLPRVGHRLRRASAWASAGTSGSRRARARMALQGAEVLLYPTAIGSDPPAPDATRATPGSGCSAAMRSPTRCRWWRPTGSAWRRRPAASRASASTARRSSPSQTGALLAEASRDREEVITATVDLDAVRLPCATTGASSAIGGPSCTGRCSRSTARPRPPRYPRRAAGCAARRSRGA